MVFQVKFLRLPAIAIVAMAIAFACAEDQKVNKTPINTSPDSSAFPTPDPLDISAGTAGPPNQLICNPTATSEFRECDVTGVGVFTVESDQFDAFKITNRSGKSLKVQKVTPMPPPSSTGSACVYYKKHMQGQDRNEMGSGEVGCRELKPGSAPAISWEDNHTTDPTGLLWQNGHQVYLGMNIPGQETYTRKFQIEVKEVGRAVLVFRFPAEGKPPTTCDGNPQLAGTPRLVQDWPHAKLKVHGAMVFVTSPTGTVSASCLHQFDSATGNAVASYCHTVGDPRLDFTKSGIHMLTKPIEIPKGAFYTLDASYTCSTGIWDWISYTYVSLSN